jgi:hypothetical protein
MDGKKPTFSTDHLYLCAYLICLGHVFVATSHVGKRVCFEFADTPELNADVTRFMAGAAIPARQFSFEVLRLKRMIHQLENKVDKNNEREKQSYCKNIVEIRKG